jgi:hypothetical protein
MLKPGNLFVFNEDILDMLLRQQLFYHEQEKYK